MLNANNTSIKPDRTRRMVGWLNKVLLRCCKVAFILVKTSALTDTLRFLKNYQPEPGNLNSNQKAGGIRNKDVFAFIVLTTA